MILILLVPRIIYLKVAGIINIDIIPPIRCIDLRWKKKRELPKIAGSVLEPQEDSLV